VLGSEGVKTSLLARKPKAEPGVPETER
jgi:hypothetical protein